MTSLIIFEPFRRGSKGGSQIKGLGLGLSTAKKLIDAMGGHINVESKLGKGSEFTVKFPIRDLHNRVSVGLNPQ